MARLERLATLEPFALELERQVSLKLTPSTSTSTPLNKTLFKSRCSNAKAMLLGHLTRLKRGGDKTC